MTLWYVGVLVTTLGFLGGLLYTSMAFGLRREIQQRLALQADGVAKTVIAFREAEKSAPNNVPGNWQSGPVSGIQMPKEEIANLIRRWDRRTGLLETEGMVRLMDRGGEVLIASKGFEQFGISFEGARMRRAQNGMPFCETIRIKEGRLLLLTYPVTEQGRVQYVIQTAASLAPIDLSLRQLQIRLALLIPLAMLLAGFGGWLLVGWALKPVDRMALQARTIGAQALDRRIEVPVTGDELERLARTFNDLLDRIEVSFRRQRQFGAAASHELRTPLTIMRGELEVALRKPRSLEEYERVLKTHLQTINELAQIVEDLLVLARWDAAGIAVDWQSVELRELSEEVRDTWHKVAHRKGVSIEIEAARSIWVRGEKHLLTRLVSNLVDNAIRHAPEQSTITVRSDFWRDKACLTVQDAGPGIPADDLPRIFDRFFEGKNSSSNRHSIGFGLGLCRWIAEVHHGQIEAASPPGQGALFTVWLPLLKD